jgi:hypothetical protein
MQNRCRFHEDLGDREVNNRHPVPTEERSSMASKRKNAFVYPLSER